MGPVLFLVATLSSAFLQDVCGADLEHFQRSNFTNIDNMRQDDTFVYLENVHGVPTNEYVPGICNPNDARAQYRSIRLPIRPQKLAVPLCLPFGIVGIAINSVAFYHPLAGGHVNAVEGGTTEGFDICGGHADPTESYHYHKIPEKHLNPKERNSNLHAPEHDQCPYTVGEIDKMIGVALDGFFIYGPLVTIGGQVYDFRNSNTPANGIALDECHGIEIDAENQQYVYIANEVYPYIMGCYRGEPSLLSSFQMYECTAAVAGSLCDCCEGHLSRKDVTDDNEPCPYECTYQGTRVKRQIPELFSDPHGGGMPFGQRMENQQPENSLLKLFQRYDILPQNNRRWYSFNRQSVEHQYTLNNEPVSGVIVPTDNNHHSDNEMDNDSGVNEDDLLHCMRGPPQDGQRPPPERPQGQGGPPPKRGPPPNGDPPPKKAGGGGRDQNCSRNDLRIVGNRRKRAIVESLQKLIKKLSVYN